MTSGELVNREENDRRIRKALKVGHVDPLIEQFHTYVAQTSDHSLDFPVTTASGVYIRDAFGQEFLDFTSGIGVMNLGHDNALVIGEIKSQLDAHLHTMVYGEHVTPLQVNYARAISEKFPKTHCSEHEIYNPQQVFFVNSGNESVDLSLKMARKITGRKPMLALKNGFHGRGYGAMSVSWRDEYKRGFFVDDSTTFLPTGNYEYGDLDQYAGVILELVQGEAGCLVQDEKWIQELVQIVRDHGGLVIIDEVQTGYGRTGTFLAQEQFGVDADITCLGKAGGGGLPFGAVVSARENFEKLQTPALSHLTTFGGNPVVMAAGLATIDQIHEGLLENVMECGKLLWRSIDELSQQFPTIIQRSQGLGLMQALILKPEIDTERFYTKCKEKGLLLHFKLNAGQALRMSPPLVISERGIREAVDILADVCLDWESE